MDTEALIQICLQYPGASLVYPFDEPHAVVKHTRNGKWFALITHWQGRVIINLKCPPEESALLRRIYSDIVPAWHMNKTHWNTIFTQGNVPADVIGNLIAISYNLTAPRVKHPRGTGV